MEPIKTLNIKQPIIQLKTLNNGRLGIVDAHTTLRLIDPHNYQIVGGFKTNVMQQRSYGYLSAISDDATVTAAIIPDTNKAALFSVAKKGLMYKAGRHQGQVESVAIDPLSRYLVTGGEDGKVFSWALKTAKLAFTMPPHSDYVTSIGFSVNGQWIATGSFDRTVNVMNIATMKPPHKLRGHTAPVVDLRFLPEFRLLSVDKEGGLIVWDIQHGKLIKRLTKMNDDITALCLSYDRRFLFVGTKLGYIALYDMNTLDQIKLRYLKESETVTSMAFIEDGSRLAVGGTEGLVRIYALHGDTQMLMELIRNRRFKEYYQQVEENPMIMYDKSFALVEKLWNDTVDKAKVLMERNDIKAAKVLFEPFMGAPNKTALIQGILRDFEKYTTFKKYVDEGRYALAYSLAAQHKSFKESELYRKMETRWKKLFFKAQELILSKNGEEQARQLLAPYRGISDKTALIQQLFSEQKLYVYFKKLIAAKEFVKLFELVKNHPFLAEFAEYAAVLNYADTLYMKSQQAYQSGDYITAERMSEGLLSFPDYAEDAKKLKESIKAKQLFTDAIEVDNLANAFAYLATYPMLYETPEGRALEAAWNEKVDLAQKYAAKGNAGGVRECVDEYMGIEAKYLAMANLFQQCYNVQLEQAMRQGRSQSEIETGIKNYIAMFGVDDFVRSFFDIFSSQYNTRLVLDDQRCGSLESWRPNHIISDILAPAVL